MGGPRVESEVELMLPHHAEAAAGKRLALTILTPKGQVLAQAVDELTAPGTLGEFGVLPGHIPFLTGVRAGVLSYKDQGERHVLAVGQGYCQVGAQNRI